MSPRPAMASRFLRALLAQWTLPLCRPASSSSSKNLENPDYEYDNELITGHGLKRVYRLRCPVKPYHDPKSYDSVFLPNNMKLLLVSVPTGTPAKYEYKNRVLSCVDSKYDRGNSVWGCSMTVGVGHFSDPPEVPGLANLLRRIALKSSKKYPGDFEGFEAFLRKKGGYFRGSTGCELTTFSFGCRLEHLCEALFKFGQYFIDPLMAWFVMDEERKSIDRDFLSFTPSDTLRMEYIISSTASSTNPAAKNKWGNFYELSKTFNDKSLCDAVNHFRSKYYSANLMTLYLKAELPLKILRKIAVDSFAEVPNYITMGRMYESDQPFEAERFRKIYLMKCDAYDSCLTVNWVVPPSLPMYRMNALEYIARLVRREGRGSLIKYLRKKSWANNISAGLTNGEYTKNTVYSMFRVSIGLFEEQKCFTNDILGALFSYINMIRLEKPCESYFKELYLIGRTAFAISDERPTLDNVEFLSQRMQYFDSIDYLTGDEVFYEFWPNLISQYMELLVPDKANFVFRSKHWWKPLTEREPILGTNYAVDQFSEDIFKEWESSEPLEEFHFPLRNDYISLNFKVHPYDQFNEQNHPKLIKKSNLREIWYKQDGLYKKPVTLIKVHILNPRVFSDISAAAHLDLYVSLLNHFLSSELFSAREALINWDVSRSDYGITISVWGLSEKVPLVLRNIGDFINDLPGMLFQALLTSKKNHILKDYYRQHLNLRNICVEIMYALTLNQFWLSSDKYSQLSKISLESIRDFAYMLWKGVHAQCLVQGNITTSEAIEAVDDFLDHVHCTNISRSLPKVAQGELEQGEKCCLIKTPYQLKPVQYIFQNYFIGQRSPKPSILGKLLVSLLQSPPYVELSRKYIPRPLRIDFVDSYGLVKMQLGVGLDHEVSQGVGIVVNNQRITNFLQESLVLLRNTSPPEYKHFVQCFTAQEKFTPISLEEEFKNNWFEIIEGAHHFNFSTFEGQMLEMVTVKDLIQILEPMVNPNHGQHKKLSVYAYGLNEVNLKPTTIFVLPDEIKFNVEEENDKPSNFFINDIASYKSSLKFRNEDELAS